MNKKNKLKRLALLKKKANWYERRVDEPFKTGKAVPFFQTQLYRNFSDTCVEALTILDELGN
jgi:hypothetical protein